MTEKDFAFGTEDLESAEYLLSMVGGIAGLMETTGKGCVDNTESVPWSAMAINYLLDEAQERFFGDFPQNLRFQEHFQAFRPV